MKFYFSPAKLNLFLKILGKRSDGYHELFSLFQACDFGDVLTFEQADKDHLKCKLNDFPLDANNLIIKALDLFREKSGIKAYFKVAVEKKIPMGAGLGGGSSNAATALWACNDLLGRPVIEEDLAKWGAELGSDVNFFFSQGLALCRGRGEQVESITNLELSTLTLVKPKYSLSTPEVYKHYRPSSETTSLPEIWESLLKGIPPFFNDLEAPACLLEPRMKILKADLLARGYDQVVMTGSGSTFFCIGKGNPPNGNDLLVIQVSPLRRNKNEWYLKTILD